MQYHFLFLNPKKKIGAYSDLQTPFRDQHKRTQKKQDRFDQPNKMPAYLIMLPAANPSVQR